MAHRLVTVATFATPLEAHLARGHLESAGIPAFVREDSTLGSALSTGGADVRLDVSEDMAWRALELLGREPARATPELELRCPICGSSWHEPEALPVVLRVVLGLARLLLSIPEQAFPARTRRCRVCGSRWRPE